MIPSALSISFIAPSAAERGAESADLYGDASFAAAALPESHFDSSLCILASSMGFGR